MFSKVKGRIFLCSGCWIAAVGTAVSQPASLPPSHAIGIPVNYVRTWIPVRPESSPNNISVSADPQDFRMQTEYTDGLGRTLQVVAKKAALNSYETGTNPATFPYQADVVEPIVYDEYGRHARRYLPFPANNAGSGGASADGFFKYDPVIQQVGFFNSYLAGQQGEVNVGPNSLNWAYSQTLYESASSNRVVEAFAPGRSWVGTSAESDPSNRHSVKIKYASNTPTDAVRIWNVTNSPSVGGWGSYQSPGLYTAGMLHKQIITSENNKQSVIFSDKSGKIILRKVQLTSASDDGSGSGYVGWICTYYLYDDQGRIRCVIQPDGVNAVVGTWALGSTELNEQCFRYEYDEKGRIIVKKAPGAVEEFFVYDIRDRLILQQDAGLRRSGEWLVYRYDDLDRVNEIGKWASGLSAATHRSSGATGIGYPVSPSNYEALHYLHYDDYVGLGGGLTSSFDNTWSGQFVTSINIAPLYARQMSVSAYNLDRVTWVQTKVLDGSNSFSYTVNLYDEQGRLIQKKTKNHTGGTDVLTTQYNWQGQVLVAVEKLDKVGPSNPQTIVSVKKYTYDNLSRLIKIESKTGHNQINAGTLSALPFTVVLENKYDHMGQLKKKTVGSKKDPSTGTYYTTRVALEEKTFDYNIRGWLLGVNRDMVKNGPLNNYFGYDLGFDAPDIKDGSSTTIGSYGSLAFTGTISGTVWRSKSDGIMRKYDYTYDQRDRLLQANFSQYQGGTWNQTDMNFSVNIGSLANPELAYTANGNILKMQQMGRALTGNIPIDDLTYSYYNGTNKLQNVSESPSIGTTDYRLGDFTDKNTSSADYGYDYSGNLITDLNKGLGTNSGIDLAAGGGISYNFKNLPTVVTFNNGAGGTKGIITYQYAANGLKLKKIVEEFGVTVNHNGTSYSTTVTTTTTYLNNAVFESKSYTAAALTSLNYTDKLMFIGGEEGRMRPVFSTAASAAPSKLEFDYMLKDHVGNVRMILTEQLQQDQYPALSFEGAAGSTEATNQNTFWENRDGQSIDITSVRTATPGGFNASSYAMLVRKSTGSVGAAKLLKVMSGDRIHTKVDYFYTATSANNTLANGLSALLAGLAGAFNSSSASSQLLKNGSAQILSNLNADPLTVGFFGPQTGSSTTGQPPKAYLHVLLFDELFRFDATNSFVQQVAYTPNTAGSIDKLAANAVEVKKNGFAFVYFSNESDELVHFDNFLLTHERGQILEETHYYPFGLEMKALSSKAYQVITGRNNFGQAGKEGNSKEFSDNSGLDWTDFGARMYDYQIGRWHRIDPIASQMNSTSPFAYVYNNPIRYSDLGGAKPFDIIGLLELGFRQHNAYVSILETIQNDAVFREQTRLFTNEGMWGASNIDLAFENKELYFGGPTTSQPPQRRPAEANLRIVTKTGARLNVDQLNASNISEIKGIQVVIGIDADVWSEELTPIISHEINAHGLKLGGLAYDYLSGKLSLAQFQATYKDVMKVDDPISSDAHKMIGLYSGGFASLINSVLKTLDQTPMANVPLSKQVGVTRFEFKGPGGVLSARHEQSDTYYNRVVNSTVKMIQTYNPDIKLIPLEPAFKYYHVPLEKEDDSKKPPPPPPAPAPKPPKAF